MDNPFEWLAVFIMPGYIHGTYTPEPVGNYYTGPNHIYNRRHGSVYSPVTVIFRKSSALFIIPGRYSESADDIIKLATVEGLTAHTNSVKVRKEKINGK